MMTKGNIQTPVTLESIAVSIGKLATKEELGTQISKLASREELDLKITRLATKEDIGKLATRRDMEDSIEELAQMVGRQFSDFGKRMDGMETRLTDRIDAIEQKVDDLDLKVDRNHEGLSNQVDAVYLNYVPWSAHIKLDTRVKVLERKK